MCLPAESATGKLSDTEYPTGQLSAIITPIVACLDGAGAEGKNARQQLQYALATSA